MPRRLIPSTALALAAGLLLTACGGDPEFRTRDITDALPELEFELQRAPGETTVTEADFEDKVVAMFFGYTHCPDYCPATLNKLAAVIDGLDNDLAEDLRVVFVSVDPQRDSPEQLARYVGGFGDQFVGLRGDWDTLRDLTRHYRTTFSHGEPDENGFYEVTHSTATFIFGRNGESRLLAGEDTPVRDLEHDLRILLEE